MSAESTHATPERVLDTISGRVSGLAMGLWLLAILVGAVGVFTSISDLPVRTWQAIWFNFLYWTALAEAGVIFGAVLVASKGHWGQPFLRVAEPAGAFLPLSLLVFAAMYFGAEYIFPWMDPAFDGHLNTSWVNHDAVFLRNGAMLVVLYLVSFYFLRVSLRPDARHIAGHHSGWRAKIVGGLTRGWRGDEAEAERSRRILGWLSPVLLLLWTFVFSFMAFDLAQSLMRNFISVIWGAVYMFAGWLSLLGLVAVLAHRYRERHNLGDVWGKWEFHDLGKLMFAFVIFWAYIWFSQFLVIWYGNMGRETIFFEQRTVNGFGTLLWLQMGLMFLLPFFLLLVRRPKMNPRYLAFVGLILLAGVWLERYMLVVPSTWHGEGIPFGWPEIAVTIGFVGLFGLCYSVYASLTPRLPIADTLIRGTATKGP